MIEVAIRGKVSDLSADGRRRLMSRNAGSASDSVRETAKSIIARVRTGGDAELIKLASELDCVRLDKIEVPRELCVRALKTLQPELRSALERAARNILAVHSASIPVAWEMSPEPGIVVGRRPDPLSSVGVYAPGGRASYPSSVLMGAIPARAAGVKSVLLGSPPDPNGLPAPAILAAAEIAGVDRVFAIGGAGAVAAFAYGTESVPRVDRIVGPGNAYVAEAKLQVATVTGIDSPAGPSELLIIADETADPRTLAAEMVAQAEHDPDAVVVLILVGDVNEQAVLEELTRQSGSADRSGIVRSSLESSGAVLRAENLAEAIQLSNEFAPEHLQLNVANPDAILPQLRNAGAVFLGSSSSVAFGDYMTGANHVLPTGGLARSYSGLSTLDFVRWTSYQSVTPEAAQRLSADVQAFANAEFLAGHAQAAAIWSRS